MREINAGDLVVVARVSHACADRLLGRIYRVSGPSEAKGLKCPACAQYNAVPPGEPLVCLGDREAALPVAWLRKIPPLSEPEHVENREEITA